MTDRERFQEEIVEGPGFPTGAAAPPRGSLGPSRMEISKPMIAAVEGPTMAGSMGLALWCDVRVMAETTHPGVYCRRWVIPLLDGSTVGCRVWSDKARPWRSP